VGDQDTAMKGDRVARIAFRLSGLVIAAGALAFVCRQGTSLFGVGIVFVGYVAAATLWVRGQYQASVDAALQGDESLQPWTFKYRTSGSVVLVGFIVAACGIVLDIGTALIAGVLMSYLGLGYVLMRFRMYASGGARLRVHVGVGVLVGVTVLVVMGLLALEDHGWAVFPVAASFLFAPIGLSLLAEPAIRWLQRPGRGLPVVVAASVGAAALLLDIGIAVARVDTRWMAFGFIALALLVLAIVSSTQADIAVVIAAVTLMGVTSMSDDKREALKPQAGQTRVLVALGDSYLSGEGADIYYTEEADDKQGRHENHCNRAPTAWAAMAGQTKRLFDSVAFVACSGARTYNVQHEMPPPADGAPSAKAQYNEPGTQLDQVDALKKGLKEDLNPSLVVVSLGGNDAGFSTIGMMCLAPGNCSDKRDLWETNLARVGNALNATYSEIRREFPKSPVLVTAYPAPIYTIDGEPVSCDQVALSTKDMSFISDFVTKLNDTVERAATSEKFYFLSDMEQALASAHLQLCDPLNDKRPGINFIGLRSVSGIAEQRFNPQNWYHNSLHPNERGHAAMLQVFEQWRAEHPDPYTDAPAVTAGGATGTSGGSNRTPEPPCDLVEDSQSTTVRCVDEGAAWAKGQLSDTILWHGWGLQVAVATLAAWLLAVALFGWWKPWWPDPPGDAA
jgi:lysophospholipase L1-like esterase